MAYEDKEKKIKITLKAKLVQSSKLTYHVVIYDEKLMAEFDQNNVMQMDSTFRMSPYVQGAAQFMTIMCRKYTVVSILLFNSSWCKLFFRNVLSTKLYRVNILRFSRRVRSFECRFQDTLRCWFKLFIAHRRRKVSLFELFAMRDLSTRELNFSTSAHDDSNFNRLQASPW